jgi:hypothetical protein
MLRLQEKKKKNPFYYFFLQDDNNDYSETTNLTMSTMPTEQEKNIYDSTHWRKRNWVNMRRTSRGNTTFLVQQDHVNQVRDNIPPPNTTTLMTND